MCVCVCMPPVKPKLTWKVDVKGDDDGINYSVYLNQYCISNIVYLFQLLSQDILQISGGLFLFFTAYPC